MIENVRICVNAVLPMFIYIIIGAVIKKTGMMNAGENRRFNKILFTFFYPVLLFSNIYEAEIGEAIDLRLIVFAVAFVLASVAVITVVIKRIEKNHRSCGAMIHAIYRSNFVLMGIMVIESIFGDEGLPVVSVMVTIVVPLFNVIAVVLLESFRGGSADVKGILVNTAKNPLILGAVIGVIASLAGLSLPHAAKDVISGIASATPAMALIMLGAAFDPSVITSKRRNIAICVIGRLLVVPMIGLPVAAAMGFRGPAFVTLLIMMASPTAVSSFPMAVAMDSDGELAGSAVMISTPLSMLTLFMWLFIFKNLGVF